MACPPPALATPGNDRGRRFLAAYCASTRIAIASVMVIETCSPTLRSFRSTSGRTLTAFFEPSGNVPVFGILLLPVKLLFITVLGFCVAHTLNDILARFTDLDLRDRLEKRLDR